MWFPKVHEAYWRTDDPGMHYRPEGYADQHWARLAALGQIVQTEEEALRIWAEAGEKARKVLEPKPWAPTEQGQKYFYALGLGHDEVSRTTYIPGNPDDERLIKAGNCFATEEDCIEYIEAERKTRDEIRMKQAKRRAAAEGL